MTISCEFRVRFTLFLTVWMATVGMGVSISHAHMSGGRPHTHGLGLFSAAGQRLPVGPSGDTNTPHRHLILFGVELTGEPTPDAAGTGPALDVADVGARDADELDWPLATTAFALQPTIFLPVASPAPNSVTLTPAPAVDLCHFARHALAGVLRS